MAYSTLQDLKAYIPKNIIIQATDDNGVGEIDTEIVNEFIDRSDKKIDGFLRGRYPVPITDTVPEMIQDISTTLTGYALYRRKLQTTLPDAISKDYDNVMKMLFKIQEGKVSPFEAVDEPTKIITNKTSSDKTYPSTVWSQY